MLRKEVSDGLANLSGQIYLFGFVVSNFQGRRQHNNLKFYSIIFICLRNKEFCWQIFYHILDVFGKSNYLMVFMKTNIPESHVILFIGYYNFDKLGFKPF